jgi:hypothetical protein
MPEKQPMKNWFNTTLEEFDIEDQAQLNHVASYACGGVLPWWDTFTKNIANQGWISERQRAKLFSFDGEKEISRAYTVKPRKGFREFDGLDHDQISDFTGESSAFEFDS